MKFIALGSQQVVEMQTWVNMADYHRDIFIQTAGFDQAETITDILADASQADPVITWVSADPAYQKFLFTLSLPLFLPHGHVYFTADRQGAALWLPPNVLMNPPMTIGLVWSYVRRSGIGSIRRFFSLLKRMEKNHPAARHYYFSPWESGPEHKVKAWGRHY